MAKLNYGELYRAVRDFNKTIRELQKANKDLDLPSYKDYKYVKQGIQTKQELNVVINSENFAVLSIGVLLLILYASTARTTCLASSVAFVFFASCKYLIAFGAIIVANTAIIAITTNNSVRVKPLFYLFLIILSCLHLLLYYNY